MGEILRIGTVTAVNEAKRQVRVQFPDVKIVSGWLKVIKSPPYIPKKGVQQRTENAYLSSLWAILVWMRCLNRNIRAIRYGHGCLDL